MKKINLEIIAKDTKIYTFRLRRNGVAVDISGWTLYFTVKSDLNDADSAALINKNVLFPTNAESQAGIGYLTLSSAETDITLGEHYYDAKFIAPDYRETFLRGRCIILPSARIA